MRSAQTFTLAVIAAFFLGGCGCEQERDAAAAQAELAAELERAKSDHRAALVQIDELREGLAESQAELARAREAAATAPDFDPAAAVQSIERLKAEIESMRSKLEQE